MNPVKTLFIGTSSFAVPILEELTKLDFIDLVGVVTQPDRPVGRKQLLTPPPVKQFLIDNGITVNIFQPEKIRKEYEEILRTLEPELIVVASYGQILPNNLLQFPKHGSLNLHVSLLPHLRGAVPMNMAILEGLSTTGVTMQKMVYELDAGPIVAIREFELDGTETVEDLERKSVEASIDILRTDLPKWLNGEIEAVPQDESKATFCNINDIAKEKAEITFEIDVIKAERMTRAFYPWPIAWITIKDGKYKDKRLKVYESQIKSQNSKDKITNQNSNAEEVVSNTKQLYKEDNKLFLNLQNGVLELLEVQLEGKQRLSAKEYLYLVD